MKGLGERVNIEGEKDSRGSRASIRVSHLCHEFSKKAGVLKSFGNLIDQHLTWHNTVRGLKLSDGLASHPDWSGNTPNDIMMQ